MTFEFTKKDCPALVVAINGKEFQVKDILQFLDDLEFREREGYACYYFANDFTNALLSVSAIKRDGRWLRLGPGFWSVYSEMSEEYDNWRESIGDE